MSSRATREAAIRARSTADRLIGIRERMARLEMGVPATVEDAQLARERAWAQEQAVSRARERLIATHERAAARHQAQAQQHSLAGRTQRARTERREGLGRRRREGGAARVGPRDERRTVIAQGDVPAGTAGRKLDERPESTLSLGDRHPDRMGDAGVAAARI